MKKQFQVLISTLLLLSLIVASPITASAASATHSEVNDIAEVCYLGYNGGTYGPIMILQATLKTSSSSKSVYMVCMSGTEYVTNQSTWLYTDLLAGFSLSNAYLKNVVNVISNNIPAGSNLYLAGHSLGGMIAQEVAANSTIKANYNILYTVTFGSPMISGTKEGTLRRLGDTSDIVPFLSSAGILLELSQNSDLIRVNGGYGANILDAHLKSYLRSDLWGKYDVTGSYGGSATLTYNLSNIKYFKSPSA